jgi:hypothetical protein
MFVFESRKANMEKEILDPLLASYEAGIFYEASMKGKARSF